MKKSKPAPRTEKHDTEDVIFRTWKLTPEARAALADLRGSRGCETNQLAIDATVANMLPAIVTALLKLGASSLVAKHQTYRLPMSPFTLQALQDASQATGCPSSHLFLLSVAALLPAKKTKKGAK